MHWKYETLLLYTLWRRSAGLKNSDQPAGPAASSHIVTVHLSAATVFLSHITSRYSVLAYFFRQTNGAKICMLVTIHSQIFVIRFIHV